MNTLIGLLSARPMTRQQHAGEGDGNGVDLIRQINARINPPTPLTAPDVHIRALRLISDEVNDHGGRFPREEHQLLCELLVDTPVLIGHDRTRLPVARNFAARCSSDGERQWIEVWFYWLRGDGAHQDQLAADIDAGVVKEGSIGFEFRKPQCSICGQDIRACEHLPDQEYVDADGTIHTAHYEYRDIRRVLEISLVYRGATPGTRFVDHAAFCKQPGDTVSPVGLAPLADGEYAVILDRAGDLQGEFAYLAARRTPHDIRVCNEITFHSPLLFEIGDCVAGDAGQWKKIVAGDSELEAGSPGAPDSQERMGLGNLSLPSKIPNEVAGEGAFHHGAQPDAFLANLTDFCSTWHPPRPLLRVSLSALHRRPHKRRRCCRCTARLRNEFGIGSAQWGRSVT